jgi:hypothetical protein
MTAKKTRTQRRIESAPASAFRKLSKTELSKLGLSSKSERYIEIGKRVSKNTTTISKRAFTIKQYGAGPEKLAAPHKEGDLIYKSRKTQEAAEKQKITRGLKKKERILKEEEKPLTKQQIDVAYKRFEREVSKPHKVTPTPWASHRYTYRVSEAMRSRLPDLYRRKIAGEYIRDGEWQVLADEAYRLKDPMLARILKSAPDKNANSEEPAI